ncbi:MAG: cytochrome c biogenesis protein CcsA, partial [Opitutaceae bacterium]|nr:cytochrome c biogenesis protein CcsA [Opitutaceae bacterium]
MKKHLPWIVTALAAAVVAALVLRTDRAAETHWQEFGRLPVLVNGRIQPLDTVARTSLLGMLGKQQLRSDGETLPAIKWLGEALFEPRRADDRKVFRIDDPDVLGLFGWEQKESLHTFSFNELRPHFAEIDRQAQLADPIEPARRTRFQDHILKLYRQLVVYQHIKNTLQPEDSPDFSTEIAAYQKSIAPGVAAMNARDAGQAFEQKVFEDFLNFAARYRDFGEFAHFRPVPPDLAREARDEWETIGTSLVQASSAGAIDPVVAAYARLGTTYRSRDVAAFNETLTGLTTRLTDLGFTSEQGKADREAFFNKYQPFYRAMVLYVLVGLLAVGSWVFGYGTLGRTALWLGCLAFAIHSSGLAFRMFLEGRPPVTNLYSAAVFVGWGAAAIGLIVERMFRNGIGAVSSALVGFTTLLIAHHLGLGNDTMEMMVAVLDSNFWLSVHVPTIVLGYSATYAAGAIGLVFIFLGVFTRLLTPELARTLTKMSYGVICFATLLSFLGTVLGGIWADQSWGRFWGWDPKENGAALIVLWCAIILHARWGGYIRERG